MNIHCRGAQAKTRRGEVISYNKYDVKRTTIQRKCNMDLNALRADIDQSYNPKNPFNYRF